MAVEKIPYSDVLDIIFENRNKEYGAYDLRRRYPRHVRNALIITLLLACCVIAFPYVKGLISPYMEEKAEEKKVISLENLPPPPPIDKNVPPPPPPPPAPPPPKQPQIKYVPPVVKKDEEVKEEEKIVKQEEMKEIDPGTKTVEGDKNAAIDTAKVKVEIVEKKEEKEEEKVIEEPKPKEPEIFTVVEQMPEFPGGEQERQKYLQKNIEYPPMARENGIEGKVFVQFVVNEDGSISDVTAIRGIGGGCDQESVRVVKSMPAWKVGKQNGQPVKVRFTMPVQFKLD